MGKDKYQDLKRIFIVAPFFPPSAMPPAQRVRLIVQHAASLGFYPVVFTVNPNRREQKGDPWMTELAGDQFDLVTVKCLDQNITRKFKIGDLGIRMLPFLFFKLLKYARKQKPSFILYPVPPWYVLTIAPLIKFFTGVPYGIDFIDPWVHTLDKTETSFKNGASQSIAKYFEKRACKNASIIYSVSQGINDDLVKRYPFLKNKILIAVPYGAEKKDFELLKDKIQNNNNDKIIIRYIGAIWLDCFQVLDGLMPALAKVEKKQPLQVEFLGTSYAGETLAKAQLNKWITDNNMQSYTTENPVRIAYKSAVELTLQSDLSLLIGGMLPYYAASKLMGLLVSKKIFVAFVHEDSFPAKLLTELEFPYLVTYSQSVNNLPNKKIDVLTAVIERAIADRYNFKSVDLSHPLVRQHTALGMTKTFLEPIKSFLGE